MGLLILLEFSIEVSRSMRCRRCRRSSEIVAGFRASVCRIGFYRSFLFEPEFVLRIHNKSVIVIFSRLSNETRVWIQTVEWWPLLGMVKVFRIQNCLKRENVNCLKQRINKTVKQQTVTYWFVVFVIHTEVKRRREYNVLYVYQRIYSHKMKKMIKMIVRVSLLYEKTRYR